MALDSDLMRRLRAAPQLFAAIAAASGPEMKVQERLRAKYPDDVVRAAFTLVELRRRARAKFSRADSMWFDRVGLEQSTSEAVARHKARRFPGRVWDYCCGIGTDAIQLAARGEVIAVDRRPAACLCARWNAEAYGVADRLASVCADVESLPICGEHVHVDPDRRSPGCGGRGRSLRLEEGSPSLEFLERLMEQAPGGALKVGPAANFVGRFPQAEIELVSLDGECKEATIWFGDLATPGLWRATVLPAGESLSGDPLEASTDVIPLDRYLYDPDPAIVRAGLVDVLAAREGLGRLDAEEEYLTGARLVATPFARSFEVLADLPNNDRAVRGYFRESPAGRLEIKCRRIPTDAEAWRRKIPLDGSEQAVLVFARVGGRARALVCRRSDR